MASSSSPKCSISISGPTLASLLHLTSAAPSDAAGLLFGRVSSATTPPILEDDDPLLPFPPPPPPISISITSLLSLPSPSSLFDPLARLNLDLPLSRSPDLLLLGWFSSRRLSPLRPSMRESAATFSLSRVRQTLTPTPTPTILLLISPPSPAIPIHTHDYRAFQLLPGGVIEPTSLRISNVGPGFRGHYGTFSPESALPLVAFRGEEADGGMVKEQKMVDELAEGFRAETLRGMVGDGVTRYTEELEDLYGKMLAKLAGLTARVEESSAKVAEQESRNMKLRNIIAGLE